MHILGIALVITLTCPHAQALDLKNLGELVNQAAGTTSSTASATPNALATLSNQETTDGLKLALNQGVAKAVGLLGANNGFYGNPEVKIPLPASLQKMEKGLRLLGMGKQADTLVLKMNRAAELAVPEAKALLGNAVTQMSIADAKSILTGPSDAATQYFKRTTSVEMAAKFLPVIEKATANVQLADTYNKYAELGSQFGAIKKEDANINQYVTRKTLDGLYAMMAREELAIRQDPMGQANLLLKKVFGATK